MVYSYKTTLISSTHNSKTPSKNDKYLVTTESNNPL